MSIETIDTLTRELARWAELGRNLAFEATEAVCPPWDSCNLFVKSANGLARYTAWNLSKLLDQSRARLFPLDDPLTIGFALHRWLAVEREEAYSDWLAWIFDELSDSMLVGSLLYGKSVSPRLLELPEPCHTDREVWVPEGHEGRTGRLDCVLRFGQHALIVIEVKLGGAEAADTVKQSGYFRWLESQDTPWLPPILLITDAAKQDGYERFEPLRWRDFCVRGRRLIPELVRNGRLIAACLLASLLGAVEMNLLSFPRLNWIREVSEDAILSNYLRLGPSLSESISYLREVMEESSNG